jgi:hypothetical protein
MKYLGWPNLSPSEAVRQQPRRPRYALAVFERFVG